MAASKKEYGPLAALIGTWEGDKGTDTAPGDDPADIAVSPYREVAVFEEAGQVDNHAQHLFALRYRMTAWREGAEDAFHEELGYWLWDAANQQVMRCFMVPRGVTIIAGGSAAPDATAFELLAEVGSQTYGICSNRFLDENFRTERYELSLELPDPDTLRYREDTVLRIKGQSEPFHHTDENTLRRVKA